MEAELRRSLPQLNALRSFEAAARHQSFTRAADELCVTQGAVSHQVKALEAELGLKLFNRETGELNQDVLVAWQKYDISLLLRRHWRRLGPKLAGKLHVYTGEQHHGKRIQKWSPSTKKTS